MQPLSLLGPSHRVQLPRLRPAYPGKSCGRMESIPWGLAGYSVLSVEQPDSKIRNMSTDKLGGVLKFISKVTDVFA